jgi:hypothetical protein
MVKRNGAAAAANELFERIPARIERGRQLSVGGELRAGNTAAAARALTVRVTGNELASAGVRAGDQLVVDRDHPLRDGHLVLVTVGGSLAVRRCRAAEGRVALEPTGALTLPFAPEPPPHVIGRITGLIRRRGFRAGTRHADGTMGIASRPPVRGLESNALDLVHRIVSTNVAEWNGIVARARHCMSRRHGIRSERALGWARRLGQNLHALEATYTSTANPRLRKALLVEAARLSRSMRDLAAAEGWDAARIRPLAVS